MEIRKPFDRQRSQIGDFEPSITVQADVEETNINNIVARFKRTGKLPDMEREPQYGDVSHLQRNLTELVAQKQATEAKIAEYKERITNEENTRAEDAGTQASSMESPPGTEVEGGQAQDTASPGSG